VFVQSSVVIWRVGYYWCDRVKLIRAGGAFASLEHKEGVLHVWTGDLGKMLFAQAPN